MIQTILTLSAVILRIVSNPLGNVFQKQLTAKDHHPLAVNFLTYFSLSVVCIFIAADAPLAALPASFWRYGMLGGIVGAVGNGFLIKAVQTGDLSVLGPINAYKALVGMIVGFFMLGELPNGWGIVGIALIIYGSYFVLDTAAERFSWRLLQRPEIKYRIWAMVLTAVEAVFVKKVILVSSPALAFLTWCWFGALFSFGFLMISRVSVTGEVSKITRAGLLMYIGLITCVGIMQLTTNYVFDHMPVGYALSLFQLSTLLSVFLGYRIFREQDIRKKMLGAGIMIAGSVLIILMK